jgi:prepilin-type N-terminal cleavage/methylation domain-containing protein
MKKYISYATGFTLIELLVSIALMAVIGTVTVAIVSSVLRSSNKTTLAGNIRQSGNYVLEQISDTVRYATQFKVSKTNNPIDDTDSATYTSDCSTPQSPLYVELTQANSSETTFYCAASSVNPAAPIGYKGPTDATYSTLVDINAVNVSSCSFTCTQSSAGSPATIGITFTLTQKGSGNFSENNVSLPFSNSTLMRNTNF